MPKRVLINIEDFLHYNTFKFWIAICFIVFLHLIPIPTGEEDVAMMLFQIMWKETKSIYFLMGIIPIEFLIIVIPLIKVQKYLYEKFDFK